jgi:alkanesulfonate monooxygenase SsuD/methylene tetrahydromethanopterin reductase-like flavin-dependent oxidoreductase (luciferase family)
MEFGVVFATRIGEHDLVAQAERLGFRQAWFYDSQMIYSDVYATMALAAHHTRRIRLATGVAVPTTRMAPVIAHSIATVHQLAPGRLELGVGNGNTARLTMGLPPVPLARMKEELRTIRTLLDGGTATLRAEGLERPIRLLHRSQGFVRLEPRIPITLSALGPKTLAYCGEELDGHLTWGISPDGLREARTLLAEGARKAGRDPACVPSKGIFPTAVLARGETAASPRILASLASFITNYLHVQVEWGEGLLPPSPRLREVIERFRAHVERYPKEKRHLLLHEGHLVFAREDERDFLLPEIAETVAMIGEPDALIERIHALEAAGLSHFAFQVTDDPIRQMNDFAELVMRRY